MSSSQDGPRLDVVDGADDGTGAQQRPVLRVVRGNPSDVELAAITATLTALRGTAPAAEPERPVSFWANRADRLRRGPAQSPVRPGPGAWRYSLRPR